MSPWLILSALLSSGAELFQGGREEEGRQANIGRSSDALKFLMNEMSRPGGAGDPIGRLTQGQPNFQQLMAGNQMLAQLPNMGWQGGPPPRPMGSGGHFGPMAGPWRR